MKQFIRTKRCTALLVAAVLVLATSAQAHQHHRGRNAWVHGRNGAWMAPYPYSAFYYGGFPHHGYPGYVVPYGCSYSHFSAGLGYPYYKDFDLDLPPGPH
jgi:hypothetical protein